MKPRGSGSSVGEESADRRVVRTAAGKVSRSDDLSAEEKEVAAAILRANPHFGNPHVVRCGMCHEIRTLFRDEHDGPFSLTAHGWRCDACSVSAASQEVRF